MKVYQLTEKDKQLLLQELELEKFKKSQFIDKNTTEEQMLEIIWRRFHYIVSSALT